MNLPLNQQNSFLAFTLIELMVALAVSAVILVIINSILFGAIHLREKTAEAVTQTLPVDRAVAIMKQDLLGILPANTKSSNSLVRLMGTDAVVTGLAQPLGVEIYCVGQISDEVPWGDIQKVDYWLQPPTNRTDVPGKDLIRGVTRNLLSATPIQPEQQQVLLSGVQNLQFSFFDGTNWNDTWSTTLTNIPIAIKTSISFASDKAGAVASAPVQFTVPVVVWGGTNQTGTNQFNN